jgi:hypothetical protein
MKTWPAPCVEMLLPGSFLVAPSHIKRPTEHD